jgi:beta-phosphoglucomutase
MSGFSSRRIRAVLFDWDGTLADALSLHEQAFLDTLTDIAPEALARFDYRSTLGAPTRDVFVRHGITLRLDELVHAKQARYRALVADGRLRLMRGAQELLENLRRWGIRAFLVTGGSRASNETALAVLGVASLFEGRIDAGDVAIGKPAPDPYLACLERFHLDPAACVAVEDARDGVLSARAAGLPVVGVHDPAIRDLVDVWLPELGRLAMLLGEAALAS